MEFYKDVEFIYNFKRLFFPNDLKKKVWYD